MVSKGDRQSTILDRQGQIHDMGGPLFVHPPFALNLNTHLFQLHIQVPSRAFLFKEVADFACMRS